ncbi:condensin-2 complex subunit G2, partial [Thraustotheca clavata]
HAANDIVRYHAAVLLFEGFPYQDPSFLREEMDACLQKQFDAFSMLLEDLAPTVRVVAVHGICKILSMYWELLPVDTIRKCLLKCFELVHDISSYTIRVAVIDGLLLVLENHLSHLILKPLLPQLAPFIHDKQEKVRVAVARLLVRVKSIRHMHFYDIVSIDECFRRLVLDKAKPSVAKPLTELFMNSYFPQGASGSSQVARTLSLIEKYPTASLVFYRNVYQFASVGSVCKLVVLLFKCLSEDIEEPIIVTACDVMLALLESIQAPLYKDRRYAECVAFLSSEISPSHLVAVFQSAKPIVISRLWHIIANLPPNNQEDLLFHALTQLEKLNETSSKVYLAGILNALRRWGQLPTFLDTLVESFQSQTDIMDPALVIACLEVLFGSEMTIQWSDDDGPLVSTVTQLADALTRQWPHLDVNVLPRLARILFSIALQRAIPHAKALVAEYKKGPMQENSVVFPFLDFVPPQVLMDMVHNTTTSSTKKKRKQSQVNPELVLELLPVLLDTSWICSTQLFEPSSMTFMVDMVSLAHENSTIATQFLAMLWTNPCISKDADSQEFVATTTVDLLRVVLLEESSLWLLEFIMKRGISKRAFWRHVLSAMTVNSSIVTHLQLSSWKPLMDAAIEKAALDNDVSLLSKLVESIPEAQEAAKAWTSRQTRANLDLLPSSVLNILEN